MPRWTIEDVAANPERSRLVSELLWQLADDDMLMGFRDQEWLGLAPHIEEDVAFGSIGQEEIGHAAVYYGLLEQLGFGKADDLASLRTSAERRNSVLVEQPNGAGHYLESPRYDWAWTIVRHYLHDVWEMTLLGGLTNSVFGPLSDAAEKILREKRYHLAHQELWMRTMATHDQDSRARLEDAWRRVQEWAGDLADLGPSGSEFEASGLCPSVEAMVGQYQERVSEMAGALGLPPMELKTRENGRCGEHTEALQEALDTLSEVYRLDPTANW